MNPVVGERKGGRAAADVDAMSEGTAAAKGYAETRHIEKGALAPEFNYRALDDPKKRADFRAALRR